MSTKVIISLLILCTSVSMMSTDLYAPSMPYLPEVFATSPENIKLTISLNLLAYALATLFHGPLSERFGRRPLLLWGMSVFTLASFFCAIVTTIELFILSRILQGAAVAAQGVVVLTVIRDLFDDKDQVKYMAIYETAIALTPAIAPVIGAYVHIYLGWRANFYILTAVALLVTVLLYFNLRESKTGERLPLVLDNIMRDYFTLLINYYYLRYTIIIGIAVGFFFGFATAGPFILVNQHGLPTEAFGYVQALMVLTYITGTTIITRIINRVSIQPLLKTGLLTCYVSILFLLVMVLIGKDSVLVLCIALGVFAFGCSPIFSTCPTLAMNSTTVNTGAAAAMFVAVQMLAASLAALSVSVFHDGTTLPFALTLAVLTTLAILLLYFNPKQKEQAV